MLPVLQDYFLPFCSKLLQLVPEQPAEGTPVHEKVHRALPFPSLALFAPPLPPFCGTCCDWLPVHLSHMSCY